MVGRRSISVGRVLATNSQRVHISMDTKNDANYICVLFSTCSIDH